MLEFRCGWVGVVSVLQAVSLCKNMVRELREMNYNVCVCVWVGGCVCGCVGVWVCVDGGWVVFWWEGVGGCVWVGGYVGVFFF